MHHVIEGNRAIVDGDSLEEFNPTMPNFLQDEPDTMADEIAVMKQPLPGDPFDLDSAIEEPIAKATRGVIYGPHGVGKTTFASRMPSPIALFTESGERNIRIRRFPVKAETYAQVIQAMRQLLERAHDRETFVLDSLDWLEPLVWAETCNRKSITDIEAPGYGKGYAMADEVWGELITWFDAMRDAGMHVVLLAHSEVTKFEPPESDKYDRYDLALHKRARAMIHEWADYVGFAYEKTYTKTITEGSGKSAKTTTKGAGSGGRYLALQRKSTHEAKNGYGLPEEIPFDEHTATLLLGSIYASFTPAAA